MRGLGGRKKKEEVIKLCNEFLKIIFKRKKTKDNKYW